MRVAVLGASPNPERYANKAIRLLLAHGHEVLPVNPAQKTIEGLPVAPTLAAIAGPIDTVTVYVGPQHSAALIPDLVLARPRRVIVNPGAESPEIATALAAAGIPLVEACTLVMLKTGQF